MNTLWIFNPENDIALGNNLHNFTPPRNARLLRDSGAMLMSWIAGDGDFILGSSPSDAAWLKSVSPVLGKRLNILTPEDISRISEIRPWGWSRAIVYALFRLGIDRKLMPDDNKLDRIRELSHRRSSVIINQELARRGIEASLPIEITDIRNLISLLQNGQPYVIKSPWSSSGRGVIYSDKINNERIAELAHGIIRNQGSILVEPKLDKVIDFAMLFNVNPTGVNYVGLSLFTTLPGGNYAGNIIGSEHYLTEIIARHVDTSYLETVRTALETILAELIGDSYTGICGIDMMIHTDSDGKSIIAPCVELNLRTTMGYVSHCLARNLLSADETGTMSVTYTGNRPGNDVRAADPAFDKDNRLTAGSLSLIPANGDFDIRLTVD